MANTAYIPRVAIITGASRGIGRAIALRLAQDGIDIAVNDVSSQQSQLNDVVGEIRRAGRKSICLTADVTIEEQVKKMIEDTVRELGCLDIVSFIFVKLEYVF